MSPSSTPSALADRALGWYEPWAPAGPPSCSGWRPSRAFERLVGRILGLGLRAAPPRAPSGTLPFELCLARAHASLPLFAAGPVDPWVFVQRRVRPGHELEFLVRRDAEGQAGTFGFIRLRPQEARELPELQARNGAAERLRRRHGVELLPAGALVRRGFTYADPAGDEPGRNRLELLRPLARVGPRGLTHAGLLDRIAQELHELERIAWIEGLFAAPPPAGRVTQRYYLSAGKQVILVRHEPSGRKRVHLAETDEQALRSYQLSGVVSRRAFVRRAG